MGALVRDEGFLIAFAMALATSTVVVLRLQRHPLLRRASGAIPSAAALVALVVTGRDEMLSYVGLALIAVGAFLARRSSRTVLGIAVLPGALVMAIVLHRLVPDWAALVVVGSTMVATPLVTSTGTAAPRVLPLLLAATAVGMYATTPDTEQTRVLAGALLGALFLVADARLRPNAVGTALTVALLTWAVVIDGYPRQSAVVGGLACFGVAVLLPLASRARVPWRPVPVMLIVALHIGVVLVASRVAGLRASAGAAFVVAAGAWVVAAVLLRLVALRWHARDS